MGLGGRQKTWELQLIHQKTTRHLSSIPTGKLFILCRKGILEYGIVIFLINNVNVITYFYDVITIAIQTLALLLFNDAPSVKIVIFNWSDVDAIV